MRPLKSTVICLQAVTMLALPVTVQGTVTPRASIGKSPAGPIQYVSGSTHEVCVLTGHGETQTATSYGLRAADHGYSFLAQGKLWFLFGDAQATPTFRSHPNQNRWSHDPSSLVNDAIGYASPTSPGTCPVLQFPRQTTPAVGAFVNPRVSYQGKEVSLRTNESPVSGIGLKIHGVNHIYVIFSTNNPTATHTPQTCKGKPPGCLGAPYSSVMAELDNPTTMRFHGLYTLSGPAPSSPTYSAPGKFVNVALALGTGGFLYFWGTTGSSQPCAHGIPQCYRHSDVYLARMKISDLGATSRAGRPAAIEYWEGSRFVPRGPESAATPLFRDAPPCMGELGVEYNRFVRSWVMLYNCQNQSPLHPRGIYMRTAPAPIGPWSAPQTVFSPARDHGYCHFIDHPTCKGKFNGTDGAAYGPYFIAGATMKAPSPSTAESSTFFYTLDTFHPYGQVVLKTTIARRLK